MKKILTFVFACTALLSVSAADAFFRVDMDARKDKVVLKPEASEKMNATPIGWIKDVDARKYTITSWSKKKVSGTEWEDYKIVFVPATSGSIALSIGGQWAKKPEDRQWLLVNKIELNDKLYPNGDFKKTWKTKTGQVMPNGAWLSKGAKYLPTAGEKGTPAILVNHDNRLYITMKVEGGKKYELEFEVKAANPNDFK